MSSDDGTMLTISVMYRATEMDITMIGLQNAGKTSLLRVLAVRTPTLEDVFPFV